MKLKYLNSIVDSQDNFSKIPSIAYSHNGKKLAIVTADLNVFLFDEKFQKRDKFATKPVESKFGKKSYVINSLVFSPDSTKLAIGQSDQITFVYRLGDSWDEKKVICNKFAQSGAVTAMIWPEENRLIIGLADGKVRYASVNSNKCSTLYKTEVFVTTLAQHPNRRSFVSGHADGSIILFSFDSKSQSKICLHSTAPYCLLLSTFGILAAGTDRRIVSYTENGRILQQFDYSRDKDEKAYTSAVLDPSGYNAIFGSFDRLRLMSWNQRRGAWDESPPLVIKNLYTVTALSWRPDGSTVVCGAINGSVITIDCCLKRTLLKNQFETTYVSPSQVVVRDVNSDQRCVVRSRKGLNINDIRVMGRTNRYVIGYTPHTLILTDMETDKSSEISWNSGGNEKFYLDNENVCMIINAGEISLVEYGRDEIAGWIRTEKISPHLISVRLNERQRKSAHTDDLRRVAYLLDVNTISIVDLNTNNQISQVVHGSVIDWLELNETASKLLFRDFRSSLFLFEIDTEKTSNMVNFCSYVQWVPKSDVVVAQSGEHLCVWYNTDHVEQVVQIPIQGDVEIVLRDMNRTEVIVQEANSKVAYELDSTMIEFGTAIEDLDLNRAVGFLEDSEKENIDVSSMWRQLAEVALEQGNLLIAQRAYAGLNDISRVKFLADTIAIADEAVGQTAGDGTHYYKVRARMALMRKEFKDAERIYLENGSVSEAIEMYQKIHQWEKAIELAKATNYAELENLKSKYYRTLYDTGQEEKAAEIKEKEGDPNAAIDLYLKSNQPAHAARILLGHPNLANDESLNEKVAIALVRNELFDKAGELFEHVKQFQRALESYRKGKAFGKAIQIARFSFPEQVVQLEEEWGDSLCTDGKFDAAINHFLESGNSLKAADAAVRAKEWIKALQILEVLDHGQETSKYYTKIAQHFEAEGDYERAEKLYIDAEMPKEAIEMYNKAGRWSDAYKLAAEFLGTEETQEMYFQKAEELEQNGRLQEAEELYISIGEPNRAIAMYKEANRIDEMMKLIERYHTDRVEDTHKRLAEELEEKGDLKGAEEQYLLAGDWKAVVNMYKEAEQWSDAYRVARAEGGDKVHKHIAYLWAKSLGGDSAVKLLQRHGLLNEAIDMGSERGDFDFVFDLCRLGAKNKLADVQLKYAEQLEDDGDYAKSEQFYLLAGKAKEAVLMHMHNQDWSSAEKVASEHAQEMLVDVYISQARAALEQKDHQKAESYLLRANRADIILKYYREVGMWPEALRIAKEYVPEAMTQLQNDYENYQLKSGAKGALSYLAQAKDWEAQNEYRRAVECYLKVDEPVTSDKHQIAEALKKAGEIISKFLMNDEGVEMIEKIGERLMELDQFMAAGELFLLANKPQQAIQALIGAREWAKAKRVAKEFAPNLEQKVDEAYREFLKNQGRVGDLIDVDVISAIDLLVERGQWDKALETAKQQNHKPLLDKYVAMYATDLIGHENFMDAVHVFEKYGAAANAQNFNIYKKLIDQVINTPDCTYDDVSALRNMVLSLNESLVKAEESVDSRIVQIFERYQYALHFVSLQIAFQPYTTPEVERLKLHLSIAMVRYIDLFAPDKVFYEAGMACKNFGGAYENLAFVFLNQYLDICDAIDDEDPSGVDNSIFEGTDVPLQYSLPQQMFLNPEDHEEVKEWVLSVSVDKKVEKILPEDRRHCYEASSVDLSENSYPICVISGYPVIGSARDLGNGKTADANNFQVFVTITKTNPSDELFDVQQFLGKWTKSSLSLSL